jgi:ADP-heptose:LPS heptosyltransferase
VCLHAGARLRSRRWAPERFAEVGDALARLGWQVVLTGSAEEAHLTRRVTEAMLMPATDLAGKTSLGGMAALIGRARLIVCNDTGVSHIAAALGTPSVVITMASDPNRWAPLDRDRHTAIYAPIDCRPCAYELCPIGHPCAAAISAASVIDLARQQLRRRFECAPCESSPGTSMAVTSIT